MKALELQAAGYQNCGWSNDWKSADDRPEELKLCRAAQHPLNTTARAGNESGLHVVWCQSCKIYYTEDTSD